MKKTPKIKPVKAWALVDDKGKILTGTVSKKRKNCYPWHDEFWKRKQKEGYRCIPVTVSPTKKKKKP